MPSNFQLKNQNINNKIHPSSSPHFLIKKKSLKNRRNETVLKESKEISPFHREKIQRLATTASGALICNTNEYSRLERAKTMEGMFEEYAYDGQAGMFCK